MRDSTGFNQLVDKSFRKVLQDKATTFFDWYTTNWEKNISADE